MLVAEDLLLLLTDDDTGKLAAPANAVDVALGGALLIELALLGRVDVAGPGEAVREGRLVVRDARATGDDVLDEALATVGGTEGKTPRSVVTRLGIGLRDRLYARLGARGVVREEERRVLGVLARHRWPAEDVTHEADVRAAVVTAVREGSTAEPRTGALVSLLHALKVVPTVATPEAVGLSKRQVKGNAARIAEGEWAAKAVRQAIDTANAAIIAAITSATVLTASSGP
jgi:hypothetical protein